MLQIYNSLTKKKEPFKPIIPGKVGIYVCGMTVYDLCHIGHARMLVMFDVITRYLRESGFEVKYARNITDIDDKIIKRAQENNEVWTALTERSIAAMREDEKALYVLPPDIEPRATEHMENIVAMIQQLLDKDFAYVADNGDIYYRVAKFTHYGELAHQDLEKLRSGIRVDVVDEKHDPLDFVLWKLSKPGEPKWPSPWGEGRPGWHIECSAMSTHHLGNHFDIHGGGRDLIFPHHQNEIAQSEAALDSKFVNLWVHSGHVQVNAEKMSKSLGNFFLIREVLKEFDGEVIRYFMLASHYRSPVNYSQENLASAHAALERIYLALRDIPEAQPSEDKSFAQRFFAAMDDDFNTPIALSVLFDLVREINRCKDENKLAEAASYAAELKRLAAVLGIVQQQPQAFLREGVSEGDAAEIEALIVAREVARDEKNWAEADRIRGQLTALGVALEDGAQGTVWRKE